MMVMMLVLPGLAILLAPAIWLIMGRPRFLPHADQNVSKSAISIIIPARNEESNIARLLVSISQQSLRPHEIIVVDDHSTDDTARIAAKLGARVISAESLPESWMGKPWACQQGADEALKAHPENWLLFLDADTTLETGAVASLHELTQTSEGVHSVCPYHRTERAYEQLSAFFNVLMLAGVNAFGHRNSSDNHSALFGQCLLISSEHYLQVDGHSRVKDKTLENFHLAKELHQLDIPCTCYLGKGQINMRMFPSGFRELWHSWKKGFSGAASHTGGNALLLSSLWISSMMLTIVCIVFAILTQTPEHFAAITTAAYIINALQCLIVFKLAGNFSIWNALLFPICLLFYQVLFFSSIIDKKRGKQTEWKGRKVY